MKILDMEDQVMFLQLFIELYLAHVDKDLIEIDGLCVVFSNIFRKLSKTFIKELFLEMYK